MIGEARSGLPDLETVAFFDTPSYEELAVEGDRTNQRGRRPASRRAQRRRPCRGALHERRRRDPKGAALTHHNMLVNNGRLLGALFGYGDADRVCVPVPLFHCFGLVASNLAAFCHGAAVRAAPGPSFDAAEVLAAVDRERCTSLVGVPAMFLALLEHPERTARDLSSLRTGVIGGAPCPPELVRRVRAELHVPELAVAYGMTETSPAAAQTTRDDGDDARSATVGRAHPHVELKVVDAGGATVRRGQGELCARGYALMRGYWADPARTAEIVDEHGWLHTGDLATIDDDGYVRITGRLKDIIIRGGENISSREVEQLLAGHPDVDEACVIGVPDAALGEQAMAWVRLRPDATLAGEEIRLHCLRQVASFKVPRHIRIVDQLPVSDDGSLTKRRLQELAFEELGLGEVHEFVGAYR